MKILIAEDNALILKTLEICFSRSNYEIISSMDGLDAMEKVYKHKPDLIIVDIMLPYLSGLEIVNKVKKSPDAIPVVVMSAMGQQSIVAEALRLGADEYLSKPFNINQIYGIIERLMLKKVAA